MSQTTPTAAELGEAIARIRDEIAAADAETVAAEAKLAADNEAAALRGEPFIKTPASLKALREAHHAKTAALASLEQKHAVAAAQERHDNVMALLGKVEGMLDADAKAFNDATVRAVAVIRDMFSAGGIHARLMIEAILDTAPADWMTAQVDRITELTGAFGQLGERNIGQDQGWRENQMVRAGRMTPRDVAALVTAAK